MANAKTTEEAVADPLTGAELIRMVQGGVNVKGTASAVAALGSGFSVVAQTFTGTVTLDMTTYVGIPEVVFEGQATGNFTLNVTNGAHRQKISLFIKQDATGSRIWTSGANIRTNADIPSIVLSTTAAKADAIALRWNGTDGKADVLAITKGI